VSEPVKYTTKLQAGLGLIEETKSLLGIWEPGMNRGQLEKVALESGLFSEVTARRLKNIVCECFAPRYLVNGDYPAIHLKELRLNLDKIAFNQLLHIYTCRVNAILADFVAQVYWPRYSSGYNEISVEEASCFIHQALDEGKMNKRWSDSTIRRVSGYLIGCLGNYGLVKKKRSSKRDFEAIRIEPSVAVYLAYDLRFKGLSDNAIVNHSDWNLFGMDSVEVIDELKRLSRQGYIIIQSAADLIHISWKHASLGELVNVLTQR